MPIRGIRGATTVGADVREQILSRTEELLREIVEKNNLFTDDIASAIFTVTDDITAEYPAVAARKIGWVGIPLMCMREIPVKGSLPLCIRVLLHTNTENNQDDMKHVYLHEAKMLRPDLSEE